MSSYLYKVLPPNMVIVSCVDEGDIGHCDKSFFGATFPSGQKTAPGARLAGNEIVCLWFISPAVNETSDVLTFLVSCTCKTYCPAGSESAASKLIWTVPFPSFIISIV